MAFGTASKWEGTHTEGDGSGKKSIHYSERLDFSRPFYYYVRISLFLFIPDQTNNFTENCGTVALENLTLPVLMMHFETQ